MALRWMFEKVPMVSVDIDGNVELQGSGSVRFLIYGKPSSIFGSSLPDALKPIPASQIKSVEVITSPGAKYDATGIGGIINIVLIDNKFQGINGMVNYAIGSRLRIVLLLIFKENDYIYSIAIAAKTY